MDEKKKGKWAEFTEKMSQFNLGKEFSDFIEEESGESSFQHSKRVQAYLEDYIRLLKIEIENMENNKTDVNSIENIKERIKQVKKDFLFEKDYK